MKDASGIERPSPKVDLGVLVITIFILENFSLLGEEKEILIRGQGAT